MQTRLFESAGEAAAHAADTLGAVLTQSFEYFTSYAWSDQPTYASAPASE
jgi:hypothetical protein